MEEGKSISPANFTGMIFPYGSATPPAGFYLCDGALKNRVTDARLFAIIGTSYGAGDGSTTFGLPDLRSRFPLGYSASAPTKVFTFASRSSNTITVTSDVLTNSSTNELQTGQPVVYDTTSGVITGLADLGTYYLIRIAYNQFQLATSVENANSGTAISLSSDGSGTQTFTTTYSARAMGDKAGTEIQANVPTHKHVLGGDATGDVGAGSDGYRVPGTSDIAATGSNSPSNVPLSTVVNYIIKN